MRHGNGHSLFGAPDYFNSSHCSVNQDFNRWATSSKPTVAMMNTLAGNDDRIYCCLSGNKG
jgi:hypothetical protein